MSSFAYALINGMQLLRCVLPTASERTCIVESDAQPNLAVMEDFGHFEVSCLFYAGTAPIADRAFVGELIVDGVVIYLGQLPSPDGPPFSTIVTRYVQQYPKVLELRLRYEQKATYDHPDEAELLDELEQLLSDGALFPPGGSAPHTNVHNRLKDLDLYSRVVTQHYGSKWTSFLSKHTDRVLMHKDPGAELHLVLKKNEKTFVPVDEQAEELRISQENEVIRYMISILSERDFEYRELLQRMAQMQSFTSQLAPSMTMLVRFLQANKDVFWIRKDPEHTTRVGMIRH